MKKLVLIPTVSFLLLSSALLANNDNEKNTTSYQIETEISNQELNIEISGNIFEETTISLIDIRGVESFHTTVKNIEGSLTLSINLSDIENGVYFFKVDAGDEIRLKKVKVEK